MITSSRCCDSILRVGESRATATLDARDLCLDQRALAIPVFAAERMDALVLDVPPQGFVPDGGIAKMLRVV